MVGCTDQQIKGEKEKFTSSLMTEIIITSVFKEMAAEHSGCF